LNEQIVIGFTGSIGSGCTEIAQNYLANEKGFKYVSLSKYIKEEVKKIKKKPTVLDFQDFGNELRNTKSLDFLAKKAIEDPSELKNENKIVIDSIRNCREIKYLRNKFSNFYLVGVYADREVRWKRLKSDYNLDENLFNQAEERDQGEIKDYGQQVRSCMEIADVIIVNNNNFISDITIKKDLHKKIDRYLKIIELPGYRKPRLEEINMNKAYIASFRSECIKRQVGAIIVEGKEEVVISEGFNRIPNDILKSCLERYEYCYRDKQREKFLGEFNTCSACGQDLNIPTKCSNDDCNFEILDHLKTRIKMLDLCRALHAEEDAILKALKRNLNAFENTKLYTTTFPCLMCAKKIIAVGLKKIVFVEPYPGEMAKLILKDAGVDIKVFEGVKYTAFHKLFKKDRDFDKKIRTRRGL